MTTFTTVNMKGILPEIFQILLNIEQNYVLSNVPNTPYITTSYSRSNSFNTCFIIEDAIAVWNHECCRIMSANKNNPSHFIILLLQGDVTYRLEVILTRAKNTHRFGRFRKRMRQVDRRSHWQSARVAALWVDHRNARNDSITRKHPPSPIWIHECNGLLDLSYHRSIFFS